MRFNFGSEEFGTAAQKVKEMASRLDSEQSASPSIEIGRSTAQNGWLRVGAIAAASALVGGLAAAWFYRRTLSQLREAEDDFPESRIIEDVSAEDF